MADDYDAIIIGGGHNGLTCGAYLAKAGLKTLVLERRPVIGGAAVSEEIVPGFTFSVFSYVMSLLHPKVIRYLELHKFGLELLPGSCAAACLLLARHLGWPSSSGENASSAGARSTGRQQTRSIPKS